MNKSQYDKKEYRIIHTGEEGSLEALLISTKGLLAKDADPRDAKAAAAMCVQVGAFSDPQEAEGLAHYLEHMVFMGSQKYPSENGYDSYVNNHGGACNAMTEGEMTVFQFDITNEYFNKALDMFANCFISPLLKMEAADRELKAIESEFVQASMSDDVRYQQLFSHQAEDGHVLRKFSWGNMKSLSQVPQSKGVNMESMLRSFHRTHYRPENMKLVVVAPKPLDALEKQVKSIFGGWSASAAHAQDDAIAWLLQEDRGTAPSSAAGAGGSKKKKAKTNKSSNNSDSGGDKKSGKKRQKGNDSPLPPPPPTVDLPTQAHILSEQQRRFEQPVNRSHAGHLMRVLPIKNSHRLMLVWQMPSQQQDWRRKTLSYVAELIGHEGAGSIICHLKDIGYANYLSAGCDVDDNFECNSMFSLFRVLVNLTSKGLANWPYVVEVVQRYISMLTAIGPQPWFFEELRSIQQLEFTYLDEEEEEDLAERLSMNLCPLYRRDREELLGSSILLYDWEPAAVEECLRRLSPDNMLVTLSSSSFPVPATAGVKETALDRKGDEDEDEDEDEEEEEDEDEGDEEDEKEEEAGEDVSADDLRALYSGPTEHPDWLPLVLPPTSAQSARTEPHFKSTYWIDSLPASLKKHWQDCYAQGDKLPIRWGVDNGAMGKQQDADSHYLHMPRQNVYLPTDLSIVPSDPVALQEGMRAAAAAFTAVEREIEESKGIDAAAAGAEAEQEKGKKKKKKGKSSGKGQGKAEPAMHVEPEPCPLRLTEDIPEGMRAFHLVDPRFPVPKAEVYIRLASPLASQSSRGAALADLLKGALVDSLEKTLYAAALAGINSSVMHVDAGLELKFRGFSHKLPRLVRETLQQLGRPEAFVSETVFGMQVEKLTRFYRNYGMKASALANSARLHALKLSTYSPVERLKHLPGSLKEEQGESAEEREQEQSGAPITRSELIAFVRAFAGSTAVDVLSHGNLSEADLRAIIGDVFAPSASASAGTSASANASVSASASASATGGDGAAAPVPLFGLDSSAAPDEHVVKLPKSPQVTILRQSPTKASERSIAVDLYYQLGQQSVADLVALDALEQCIEEPFFDSLRTKRQLGYSVSCSMRNTFGILGFVFSVVSSSFSVEQVQEEILAFAKEVPRLLSSMDREEWLDHIDSLISLRLQPPKSISDAANHTINCVAERRYDHLDSKATEVAALRALSRESLSGFASRLFAPATRRVMAVQVSFEDKAALMSDAAAGAPQRVLTDPLQLQEGCESYQVRKLG